MFAYCCIEYPVKSLDKAFTYKIPSNLQPRLKVGMKVLVPFNNSLIHAIVLKIVDSYATDYEVKEIAKIEDEFLVLTKELLQLGLYLKELTLCNLITAYQTMLPSALKIKDQKPDYNYYLKLVSLNKKETEVLEYIDNHQGKKVAILERLLTESKVSKEEFDSRAIRELEKLGYVKIDLVQAYRINKERANIFKEELNTEQQAVVTQVKNSFCKYETFLLYGITGSGKTLVYLNLIEEVLKQGKEAILLVPEISLTEHIIKIFYDYFGSQVAIFHSGLSLTEKYDEYLKIIRKEVKIVIGTRSAIFAPLTNLGIIIIDEEHSETFKQDTTPCYHALDIAKKRCEYYNCPLLLGSATPSLESMARAQKGIYKLLTLKNKAIAKVMPKIEIIDMQEEMAKRNFVISEALDKGIKEALTKKEQVLLLLNRRGYSTIITCSNCGYTYKCPHCEISLIYHKSNNTLRCHYCGYTTYKNDICPSCKENALNYMGMGTEKLEKLINEAYPQARVLRMDADTTSKKGSHESIIKAFKNQEYDILVGTQMISKGLDFPNCTVVGIINADSTLNIPDFRSSERTFSLLLQASGRSGRSTKEGKVFIQTFNPENSTIKNVATQNYLKFYQEEMQIRHTLKYPPYYYITSLKICSKLYEEASLSATKVAHYLKKYLSREVIILGPSTALNFKLKNIYRFSIILKHKNSPNLKKVLKNLELIFSTNKKVYLEIDFNPLY